MCTSISFAQNIDFNNGGGDFLWSNTANWSTNAVPTSVNTARFLTPIESIVDQDFTIKKVQSGFGPNADFSVAGTNTLTLDVAVNNSIAIENASGNGIKFSFKCNIDINNTVTAPNNTYIRNSNSVSNSIEFESGSLLTLTTPLITNVPNASSGPNFYFNGSLAGNANISFGSLSINTFGSTAANSAYTGTLICFSNAQVIVNTADDAVFYSGPKIQVNGTGSSLTLNGANVFAAGITVGAANVYNFNVNKNQNNMGAIIFSDAGTLNMAIGNDVTNLTFANNSASPWNTGTLNITNFTEGVVRFGTDNTGLTSDQLSKIVVDGTGGAVALNSEGYLVNAVPTSVSELEINAINPIAYPTLTSDMLYFNKIQKNVKILNLNGKLLHHNTSKNQSEIGVDFLPAGFYFIVFDNQIVEKFLRK